MKRPLLWVSGLAQPRSGIRTYQDAIYPLLEARGYSLLHGDARPEALADSLRSPSALRNQVRGILRELNPAPPAQPVDAYLAIKPPYPVRLPTDAPLITLIHDLRWRRTRSAIPRLYRSLNLRLTMRRAATVTALSRASARELALVGPGRQRDVAVLYPGTDHALPRDNRLAPTRDIDILLIGGAPHKRNEATLDELLSSTPSWIRRIAAVGGSNEVCSRLRHISRHRSLSVEMHQRPTTRELSELFLRSKCFVMLGEDEGFGLTIAEALAHGCEAVVSPTSLNFELWSAQSVRFATEPLGNLLADAPPWTNISLRAQALEAYTWARTADTLSTILSTAISARA
jgi:glycosyltransferase involved in cell wall biosynthesis